MNERDGDLYLPYLPSYSGIKLTVCVDKIAASGGYMLSCVADRLIAAPFAIIGSIGATTSIPILNVEKLLKNWGIQAYTVKSGKYKGSSPVLFDAKKDQEALDKMHDDLARVHELFKNHVAKHRKMVDIELVGTGEVSKTVAFLSPLSYFSPPVGRVHG